MKTSRSISRNKKAQVTWFIIMGIVIFMILLLVIYYTNSYIPARRLSFDKSSISSYIQSCVDKTSQDGLRLLGNQGLYINPQQYTTGQKISYLLKDNKILVPSKEAIEQDLSSYIEHNLLTCLNNFSEFGKNAWTVSYEQPQVAASLNIQDVSLKVKFPVNVKKQDAIISINDFSTSEDIKLLKLYDIISRIIAAQQQEKALDLTELTRHAINLTIFPYNNATIYVAEDPSSILINKPYTIMFATD